MPFFDVVNGTTTGDQSLWNQYADGLSGAQDADVTLYAQVSPPGAPTVAVNTTAGNLTGNYQYAIAFVTGYWQGPQGSGTFHSKGNTGGGTASTTVSPNAQQVNLTNIPTGGTGVYQRIIYRTQANGTTFYYLATLADNTSTTYTDNTADSGLGAQMPTTNTTGGTYNGDASGLTNIPASELTGTINPTVLTDATTTTAGTLESAQNPASGAPIAVITNPASQAGQSINGPLTVTDLAVAGMTGAQTQSRYVGAVSGAAPTTGTFEVGDFVLDVSNLTWWICTTAGTPGTWSNFNYLRTDSGAPNPQTVANAVTFSSGAQFNNMLTVGGVGVDVATNLADTYLQQSGVATSTANSQSYTLYFQASYWNGTAAATYQHTMAEHPDGSCQINSGAGNIFSFNQGGGVQEVANQPTSGPLGVAAVVAQAQGVNVTGTAAVTILSFTPSVTGLYEVKAYVKINNGTSGNAITLQAAWFDANAASAASADFWGTNGSATPVILNGTNTIANGTWVLSSMLVYALAGDAISVSYTDPANTPNDYVSAVITRLA